MYCRCVKFFRNVYHSTKMSANRKMVILNVRLDCFCDFHVLYLNKLLVSVIQRPSQCYIVKLYKHHWMMCLWSGFWWGGIVFSFFSIKEKILFNLTVHDQICPKRHIMENRSCLKKILIAIERWSHYITHWQQEAWYKKMSALIHPETGT